MYVAAPNPNNDIITVIRYSDLLPQSFVSHSVRLGTGQSFARSVDVDAGGHNFITGLRSNSSADFILQYDFLQSNTTLDNESLASDFGVDGRYAVSGA